MKILILESATCRGLLDLIGNGACAQQCEFSKPRNTESPRELTKFTNCSLELCRVSDQTPEICLQIPCCSSQGSCRYQAPVLSQGRPVGIHWCRGAAQFSRDGASRSTLQFRAGERKGRWKSHCQYGDVCHFWTLHLTKALLEAFHANP